MSKKARKPAWWQIFALVPLMLVLLLGATRLDLPQWAGEVVEIGIVLATFGGMWFWAHVNAALLEREEMEKDDAYDNLHITVYEPELKSDEDSTEAKQFRESRPMDTVQAVWIVRSKGNEKWQLN